MIYILFFSIAADKTLFTLRASLLLLLSNDASADIADDVSSFEFSPKTDFHHPCTFTTFLQETLKQQHSASDKYYSIPKTFWKS